MNECKEGRDLLLSFLNTLDCRVKSRNVNLNEMLHLVY